MSAPSHTVWGNVIQGSSSNSQGRIGIALYESEDGYAKYVTVQVWYWSKYALTDTNNSFYADWNSNCSTLQGSKSLNCSNNSGNGWSESNQIFLHEYSNGYSKLQSGRTEYFSAKITGIDNHGISNTSSCVVSWHVPALASHTVSYNANGGSGAPSNQTKWYGSILTLSSTSPTRTGHDFVGWGTSPSDTTVDYYPYSQYGADVDITLYAIWSPHTHTVSYNANGGIGAPSSQTKTYGYVLTLSSTVPTRTGHEFVGWGSSANDTTADYSPAGQYGADVDITLYAIWRANTCTISFDANGGWGGPGTHTKIYDHVIYISTIVPTRNNYNFLGWSTYKTATTPMYRPGDAYTSNSSITLYAVWELIYVKPRIRNFEVYRCDNEGNMCEDGIYAKISFDWEVQRDGARYCAYYKRSDEDSYTACVGVDMSTTSGSVETFLIGQSGNIEFDTDYSYDIKLNVADSFGYNYEIKTLPAIFLTFDVTEDGKNMSFGESARDEDDGVLRFAFKTIDFAPTEELLYKGEKFFGQTCLWSGAEHLGRDYSGNIRTIELSKRISEMKNGIILAFGKVSSTPENFITYYVPKEHVEIYGRATFTFPLCTSMFDLIGEKTVYISNTKIEGHANNNTNGTSSRTGISYFNEAFYLYAIYEV